MLVLTFTVFAMEHEVLIPHEHLAKFKAAIESHCPTAQWLSERTQTRSERNLPIERRGIAKRTRKMRATLLKKPIAKPSKKRKKLPICKFPN